MLTNITAMVERLIGDALEREVLDGEDVFWSVSILPGQGQTQAFVAVCMKGAVVGSVIQSGVFMDNPALLTEETATQLATQALQALRTARSEQLGMAAPDPVKNEAIAKHPGGVLLG